MIELIYENEDGELEKSYESEEKVKRFDNNVENIFKHYPGKVIVFDHKDLDGVDLSIMKIRGKSIVRDLGKMKEKKKKQIKQSNQKHLNKVRKVYIQAIRQGKKCDRIENLIDHFLNSSQQIDNISTIKELESIKETEYVLPNIEDLENIPEEQNRLNRIVSYMAESIWG